MCNAYAEIGLLVFMYRVCSLCLVAFDLSDCPTYEFLQVLHLSLYTAGTFAGLDYLDYIQTIHQQLTDKIVKTSANSSDI